MNRTKLQTVGRWIFLAGVAVLLAACGPGEPREGEGEVDPGTNPPPAADVRNGEYTLLAVDGREYTLAVDFDADTWRVSGNGLDRSGTLAERGSEFLFQPGNSVGEGGTSTTRFTVADNAIVGEVALAEGALPFIASRVFENTAAAAVGRYNLLGRTVSADGTSDTTIQQAEITADGQLRTCDASQILEISDCPAASVSAGPLSVAGNLFTARTSVGSLPFRVARIGGDKVLLRASGGAAGSRRFFIGLPAGTGFASGTFVGGTTEPAWSTVSISPTGTAGTFSFSVTGTSPAGTTTTRAGTATALGAAGTDTRASILRATTGNAGTFLVTRSTELGAVVAAPGSSTAPGFMALGRSQ
jgi:hypothetical protein